MKRFITLGAGSFSGCTGLTTVNFLHAGSELPKSIFSGCTFLEWITIPKSVEVIGESAFSGCTSLRSVTWDGLLNNTQLIKNIGKNAFNGCTALSAIQIPKTVEFIDSTAFTKSSAVIQAECGTYGAQWAVKNNVKREISNHKETVKDPAVPPTTTSTGKTEGSHCSGCGEIIVEQKVIPKLNPDGSSSETSGTSTDKKEDVDDQAQISLRNAVIGEIKAFTYTGEPIEPVLSVTVKGKELYEGQDYIASLKNNLNAGTATVTIVGIGKYKDTRTAEFTINKVDQQMTVAVKKRTFTVKSAKKKARTLKAQKVFVVRNAHGAVSYEKMGGDSKLTTNKNGQIKVKKGTKKGTYSLTVIVSAAGDKNYAVGSQIVSLNVKVK